MNYYLSFSILLINLFFFSMGNAEEIPPAVKQTSPSQSLQLIIATDKPVYQLFQPIQLRIILKNISNKEVTLFHPDSIHQINNGWSISLYVRKPDGQKVRIEPEITYQNMPMVERKNFVVMEPQQEIALSADLINHSNERQDRNPWVAIIDSWSHAADKLKGNEIYVRKLKRVQGDYMFISGSQVELAVKDRSSPNFPVN